MHTSPRPLTYGRSWGVGGLAVPRLGTGSVLAPMMESGERFTHTQPASSEQLAVPRSHPGCFQTVIHETLVSPSEGGPGIPPDLQRKKFKHRDDNLQGLRMTRRRVRGTGHQPGRGKGSRAR